MLLYSQVSLNFIVLKSRKRGIETLWPSGKLLPIREIPSSNFNPETGYPENVSWFSQSLQANAGIVP
jgi:hypothetical protein